MTRLRLAFMGTPDFAVPSLGALIAAGHEIVAVYTQPARAAGRGRRPRLSPVQLAAEQQGIPVRAPRTLRTPEEQAAFSALALDAAVVVAYGLILPAPMLMAPRLGCLNIHGSLLPRWRGAAPIQRAILAGDAATGVTIMRMDAGLDTGPTLLSERIAIAPDDTAGTLHDKLAAVGARLIVQAMAGLAEGRLSASPQPSSGVTYAAKLTAADEALDWRQPAAALARRVRALSPWPAAWFAIGGERVKVLAAAVEKSAPAPPGTILDDRMTIACGEDALRLLRVQRAGRAPLAAAEFLRGYRLPPGSRLAPVGEAAS